MKSIKQTLRGMKSRHVDGKNNNQGRNRVEPEPPKSDLLYTKNGACLENRLSVKRLIFRVVLYETALRDLPPVCQPKMQRVLPRKRFIPKEKILLQGLYEPGDGSTKKSQNKNGRKQKGIKKERFRCFETSHFLFCHGKGKLDYST